MEDESRTLSRWRTVHVVPSACARTGRAFLARVALCALGHGSVKRGELAHHALILVLDCNALVNVIRLWERGTHLLVCMHRLRVLSEIIEAGKLLATMACKGAFASVFPTGVQGVRNGTGVPPRDVKLAVDSPDMACEVLAARKDHPTFAISTARKCLCGGGTIAFAGVGIGVRGGGSGGGGG